MSTARTITEAAEIHRKRIQLLTKELKTARQQDDWILINQYACDLVYSQKKLIELMDNYLFAIGDNTFLSIEQ